MNNFFSKLYQPIIGIVVTVIATVIIIQYQKSHYEILIEESIHVDPAISISQIEGSYPDNKKELEEIKNLYIKNFTIKNIGNKDLIPQDFIENLSVKVNKDWKILGITNQVSTPPGINLEWVKINEQTYEAKPFLLNSNESIFISIGTAEVDGSRSDGKVPQTTWNARIVSLDKLSVRKTSGFNLNYYGPHTPFIFLAGWSLIFTLIFTFVFLFITFMLLSQIYQKKQIKNRHVLAVTLLCLLAISSGEALAFLIFKPITGESIPLNILILSIQFLFLLGLIIKYLSMNKELDLPTN